MRTKDYEVLWTVDIIHDYLLFVLNFTYTGHFLIILFLFNPYIVYTGIHMVYKKSDLITFYLSLFYRQECPVFGEVL